jgi:hypothetical protein
LHYDSEPADGPDLATLVRLVEKGRLHPELGRIDDWSATTEVLEDLRDRRIRGNAVLSIRKETAPLSSTDPRTVVTGYVEARSDRRGPRVPRH